MVEEVESERFRKLQHTVNKHSLNLVPNRIKNDLRHSKDK